MRNYIHSWFVIKVFNTLGFEKVSEYLSDSSFCVRKLLLFTNLPADIQFQFDIYHIVAVQAARLLSLTSVTMNMAKIDIFICMQVGLYFRIYEPFKCTDHFLHSPVILILDMILYVERIVLLIFWLLHFSAGLDQNKEVTSQLT